MNGALDWTRLILAEDAKAGQRIDHLSEPWALPIQESKLSTFLSQDKQWRDGDPEIFLSGQITDAQARLNLASLVEGGKLSPTVLAAWGRLFAELGLPPGELDALAKAWVGAVAAAQNASKDDPPARTYSNTPLMPRRIEQLAWLGVKPATLAQLRPYVTLLPVTTPVNVNTAPARVLMAVIPGLDAPGASRLLEQRTQRPFESLSQLAGVLPGRAPLLDEKLMAVNSRYFEVQGRLRMNELVYEELALVDREGSTRLIWRQQTPSGHRP
jgi:general secretion pathway protein K